MQANRLRRATASLVVAALLASTGCGGGRQVLEREDLVNPAPAKTYLVTTKSGDQLTLISLHLEGDALVGTQRVTVIEQVGTGETGRENVTNRYEEVRLPWSEVARVEADRGKGADHSLVFAAGAIVVGVAAFLVLTSDSPETPEDDNGGKTP